MEITTDVTKRDLVLCNFLYLLLSSPFIYTSSALFSLAFFAQLYWLVDSLSIVSVGGAMLLGLFLVIVLGLLFLLLSVLVKQAKPLLKRGAGVKTQFSLSESSLRLKTATEEQLLAWQQIRRLRRLGNYFLLQYKRFDYLIIPLRSFASEEQKRQFVESVNSYRMLADKRAHIDIYHLNPASEESSDISQQQADLERSNTPL